MNDNLRAFYGFTANFLTQEVQLFNTFIQQKPKQKY